MRQATADTFSPHVMTQVDRLRSQGVVGEGIKVAVVDTGVSRPSHSLRRTDRGVDDGYGVLSHSPPYVAWLRRRGWLIDCIS